MDDSKLGPEEIVWKLVTCAGFVSDADGWTETNSRKTRFCVACGDW
jgi:hypothetical protein